MEEMSKNLKKTLAGYKNCQTVQRLSESLKKGNIINAEELANCYSTAENIHNVRLHCHKPTMQLDIGKIDSLQNLSKEEKDYIKKSASSLKFNLFPKADKELNNLFSTMRMKLKDLSIGRSDLMEIHSFTEEWLPYMKEKLETLEEIKKGIIADYDECKQVFEENVLSIVSKVCPDRTTSIYRDMKAITGRSVNEVVANISINMETDFGAENVASDDLADFLSACKKEYFIQTGVSVLKGTTESLWEGIMKYLVAIQASKSEDLTGWKIKRDSLLKMSKKTMRENVYSLALINDACENIRKIAAQDIKSDAEELCIQTLSLIYGETREMGIEFELKAELDWLTIELLEEVYADITA